MSFVSSQERKNQRDSEFLNRKGGFRVEYTSSIESLNKDNSEVNNNANDTIINENKNRKEVKVINKKFDNGIPDNSSEKKKNKHKKIVLFSSDNKIGEDKIADNQKISIQTYDDKSFKFNKSIKNTSDKVVNIPQDHILVFGSGSTYNEENAEDYKIVPLKNDRFILLDDNNELVKIKGELTILGCYTKQIDKDDIKSISVDKPGEVIKFFKNNPVLLKNKAIKKIIQQEYPEAYNEINNKKHKRRNHHGDNSNDFGSISQKGSSNNLTNTTSRTKDSNNDKHKHYNDKRSSKYYNQYPYFYQNQQLPMPVNGYGLDYGQQMHPINNVGNVIGIDGLGEVDLNRPMELNIQEPEKLNCFIKTKVQMQKNTYVLYVAGVISTGAGALIFGLATSIPIAVPIALAAAGLISIVANVAINASRETQNRENEIMARRKNKILQYEFLNNNKSQATTANKNVDIPVQPIYVVPQNMIPLQNTNTLQPQQQPQK